MAARQRALEVRISHISMALAAASSAGGAAAAGVGPDFVRALEENSQRAQLQLRLASELCALATNPGALRALLPHTEHASAAHLAAAVGHFHAQVCGGLLELNALFKGAWAARLWWPLLAILDFAQPYREYPQCVTVALQHLLHQPPEVGPPPRGRGGGAGAAAARPWGELMRDVADLRKAFVSEYAFQPDAIVACLEAQQLSMPRPEGGAVVRALASARAAVARPVVPWATLYQCYGSPERCGPLMKRLWAGERASLGAPGKQKLHLAAGLATLLAEWLEEARGDGGARGGGVAAAAAPDRRGQLVAFASTVRRLGVGADVERMIADLDGMTALTLGDNPLLVQHADLVRRQLRRVLQDLAAIGHM